MDISAWFTLALILTLFILLLKDSAPPDLAFLGVSALLALFGIISPEEAFSGFSNPGVLTVAALFVVAAGLRATGVLDQIGHYLFGKVEDDSGLFAKLGFVVVPMSAFLNNTPIVAMFLPPTIEWARRNRISPSRVLLPLSYLAIFGGTCTLIGTSTNLVVDGLMQKEGMKGMGLFEIGTLGLPYVAVGYIYLLTLGKRLLPDRKELLEQLDESRRDYLLEMLIQPECRLVGQTVEQAGLRNLPALFLIEIDRQGESIGPVAPDEVLYAGDRLVFTGVVSSIIELEKIPGLIPAVDPTYEVASFVGRGRRLCEAVVSQSSPLVGRSIREADFRATYGAAVVAVHRGGSRVEKKVGDIRLRPGDTLLLQTGSHFVRAHRNNPAFYLVSNVSDWRPLRRERAWMAMLIFLGLVGLMTFQIVSTVVASVAAAVGMVALGCISSGDARRSIEWQVLITIAAAFGVGTALEKTGLAASLADFLVAHTALWGPLAALAVFYIIVSLFTELITNNAAAVLLFPVALEVARIAEVSPRPFVMCLALAASASFMTPIGYQTNMMVYGPGGYRFSDFLRVGAPLKLILLVVTILGAPLVWPF